jgi:hypothetical protein
MLNPLRCMFVISGHCISVSEYYYRMFVEGWGLQPSRCDHIDITRRAGGRLWNASEGVSRDSIR